jgi:hypothetical protein
MTCSPNIEPSPPGRQWWLPSVSTVLWLVFFLAANLSTARVMMIASDSDACWHWQQGNWMLQHHAILRTEIFSHTRAGAPLVEMWWLSEIIFAFMGNLLGWGGIVLVASVACATVVWLLHRQLLAEGNELLLSTVLTLLAAAVCATHWLARPHLATQLMIVLFAWQMRWFNRGRTTPRQILVRLPLLMTLWVNLHGAFIVGFVLIGVYLAGAVVNWTCATAEQRPALRQRVMVFAMLGFACFMASLLNPNGWKLPMQVFRYTSSPLMMGITQEFLPPNFHDLGTLPYAIVLLVSLLTLLIVRPRLNVTDGLLLVVWLVLSLRMLRNGPAFALVITPILAEHWNTYLSAATPSWFLRHYRSLSARLASVNQMAGARGLPALAVVAMILVLAKPLLFGGQPLVSTELPADRFPVAAVKFLRQSPDAVHGEMFNDYVWGGYFTLAMPERKVFFHPIVLVYGEEVVRDFLRVNNGEPGWEDVLRKYHVDWTILPREHRLNRLLARRADWRLVYTDQVATIYGRIP